MRLALLIPLLAMLPACTSEPSAEQESAMISGAQALDATFLAAFNAGDGVAIAECFHDSPDTVMYPPRDVAMYGYDTIYEGFSTTMIGDTGMRMTFSEQKFMIGGDKVISWGNWAMTIPLPDGQTMNMDGRFTTVSAERDGRWVYLLDHASEPVPMPGG